MRWDFGCGLHFPFKGTGWSFKYSENCVNSHPLDQISVAWKPLLETATSECVVNIEVCELLEETNTVCVVGLLYRDMEAFFTNRGTVWMLKRAKLVICHGLWDWNRASLSLGIPVLLSHQRLRKRSAWCTSCGRGGGPSFSGSASGTSPFRLVVGSAVSIGQQLGLSLDLSDPAVCWGGDLRNLLFWSRLSLHSVKAVSEGILVFRLWHSSNRLDYTTSVSCFLNCFCKLKGVFSNSLTFDCG